MTPDAENGGAPPSGAPDGEAEAGAWADVLAHWADEDRHRAYLARFSDLGGLAVAGRRYRDVLAARPQDPLALRFRDEVVRRATVQGLAAVPRTAPPRPGGARAVRIAAAVLLLLLALAAALLAGLVGCAGGAP